MVPSPLQAEAAAIERANASTLNDIGVQLRAAGHPAAAAAAYRRALESDLHKPGLLSNFGNALKDLQRFDEAITWHRRAVELAPNSARVSLNLAVALREAGQIDEALDEFDRAVSLAPDDPSARFDRAQLLLMCGDYRRGWSEFEWRWRLDEMKTPNRSKPLWDGSVLPQATILLWPEQGFGDTILCARFIAMVKKRVGRVLLGCQPELVRLFSGLDGVDALVPYGAPLPKFDMQCPLMSLPRVFLTEIGDIPPPARFKAPAHLAPTLQAALAKAGDRLRVGIVWSGSITFRANHARSTSLEWFLELTRVPGIQLFSLQKGPRAGDLEETGADQIVINLGPLLNDFADTAAAVSQLDLIVMVDSSVAHLSASLGRPVWNLLRNVPYWVYLRNRRDTPWYPSMRLFRQPQPGDWNGVFEEVVASLADFVRAKHLRGSDLESLADRTLLPA